MKKNLGNAAFAAPYFSETETRQVGRTPDLRAVWQNNFGPPFCCVYDAKQEQHLFPVSPDEFEPLPHPHKTWMEIQGPNSAASRGSFIQAARKAFAP